MFVSAKYPGDAEDNKTTPERSAWTTHVHFLSNYKSPLIESASFDATVLCLHSNDNSQYNVRLGNGVWIGCNVKHRKLVLPEFLNDQGYLFGGNLLKWVDESAYITASLDFPGNRLVTVSLSEVNFKNPIQPGELLCFDVQLVRQGSTSATYTIEVIGEKLAATDVPLFVTKITFVNVAPDGKPVPLTG
ncbi:MAG: acyl-CoA hydrolase [Alcanivorax sp.]